uniref:Retrotransposon gag domain-containing protein n=1 Tax=Ananas comosus var. bracteatus TaxID=296719 RepID=A0A6V7NES2_ANACO|nr:unnamed protein product [Ananas comosus var. bracteatus]
MVRTRSIYKATGEQLSVLDIFRKPPTRETKSASTMSADEQIATPSDLAAKVAALSDDMKTVLDWIKTQSAAPSEYRWRRAVGSQELLLQRSKPFKVEAKIEIPNYDGVVDAEKLDAWLDQLETYFDLYNYSNAEKVTFAKLKLVGHALTWWKATLQTTANEECTWSQFKRLIRREFYPMGYEEERWKRWHVLRQRRDQTMQDYTTDFRRQALALGISLDDPQVFRKYTAGLQERINDELRLFGVRDIASASQTVMAIERKNKLSRGEKSSRESAEGSKKFKKKRSKKKGFSDPDLYCDHCKVTEYVKDRCWKLHPEMRPKKKDDRDKRTTTTATTSAGSTSDAPTFIGRINQSDTSLSLMAMLKETSLCPSNLTDKREELFTFRVQVKNEVIDAIIDPGSQKNLISENLVQRLGLSTTPHPHPYPLGWINSNIEMNIEMNIDRQCKVKFCSDRRLHRRNAVRGCAVEHLQPHLR